MAGPQKKPDSVDLRVGEKIRVARRLLGLSQTDLAVCLGVSYQQLQKYEHGKNRLGAGRLQEVAAILQQPVSFFFDDGEDVASLGNLPTSGRPGRRRREEDGIEFIAAVARISDAATRRKLLELMVAIGVGTTAS